jgi:hypothetical protein
MSYNFYKNNLESVITAALRWGVRRACNKIFTKYINMYKNTTCRLHGS